MLELIDLKKQHGTVYCTEINNIRVLFRLLSRQEYVSFLHVYTSGLVAEGRIEDEIFKRVVLDPLLVDRMMQMPAGLVCTIVGIIFRFSGNPLFLDHQVDQFNQSLSLTRDEVSNNIYDQFNSVICKAFPAYKIEDLDHMTFPEYLKRLVLAEQLLEMEPIQLKKKSEKKDPTKSFFEDAKRAKQVDAPGGPSNLDIREQLAAQQKQTPSTEMAKQMETIRRIKERQGR